MTPASTVFESAEQRPPATMATSSRRRSRSRSPQGSPRTRGISSARCSAASSSDEQEVPDVGRALGDVRRDAGEAHHRLPERQHDPDRDSALRAREQALRAAPIAARAARRQPRREGRRRGARSLGRSCHACLPETQGVTRRATSPRARSRRARQRAEQEDRPDPRGVELALQPDQRGPTPRSVAPMYSPSTAPRNAAGTAICSALRIVGSAAMSRTLRSWVKRGRRRPGRRRATPGRRP